MHSACRLQSICVVAFIFLLIGCAPPITFQSRVDSLSQTDSLAKNRYVILPGIKGVEPEDLQFQEYASYVERALGDRGFIKANNPAEADVVIFLTYGIGDPKTNYYSYSMPVWGQTGVSGSYTTGNVNVYGNSANYSQSTTYTPTYGITGSTTNVGSYTTFTRYLFLDAIDVKKYKIDKKMIQVWKTNVFSTGSSGDLRLVFPYMVAAMKPYLGTNTGQAINVAIPMNDPSVQNIKGLPAKK